VSSSDRSKQNTKTKQTLREERERLKKKKCTKKSGDNTHEGKQTAKHKQGGIQHMGQSGLTVGHHQVHNLMIQRGMKRKDPLQTQEGSTAKRGEGAQAAEGGGERASLH